VKSVESVAVYFGVSDRILARIGPMYSPVFRLIFFMALAVFCLGSDRGSNRYVTDYPGKATMIVETVNTPRFGLKPAEAAAFHTSLGRFRDLLLAQTVFHPPIGMYTEGFVRADHEGRESSQSLPEGMAASSIIPTCSIPKASSTSG
jgi:hypothetical protein